MRVTIALKQSILEGMFKEYAKVKSEKQLKEATELADRVYNEMFADYVYYFESFPEGFFCTSTTLNLKQLGLPSSAKLCDIARIDLKQYVRHRGLGWYNTSIGYLTMSESRHLPYAFKDHFQGNREELQSLLPRPLFNEVAAFCAASEQTHKDFKQLLDESLAILDATTSTKKLVEIWPKVKQFIPSEGKKDVNPINQKISSITQAVNDMELEQRQVTMENQRANTNEHTDRV